MGEHPVTSPLSTRRTTQTQNKRTQTSMPRVEFEPTTPVFERAKKVHVLDRAATVIGCGFHVWTQNAGFEAFTVVAMKNAIILNVTRCSLLGVYRRSRGV
jgi:hypothetical protein